MEKAKMIRLRSTMDAHRFGHEPSVQQCQEPSFHLHLYRLFGREMAEYFLSPSPVNTPVPPKLQRWINHMGDQMSGEALWNILRENSKNQLMKMETNCLKIPLLAEDTIKAYQQKHGQRHLYKASLVRLMFQSAQLCQAHADALLIRNPLQQFSDSWTGRGPHKYLAPDKKEVQNQHRDICLASQLS